jgi:Zn-dependent protease
MNAELTPERIQIVVQGLIVLILSVAIHEFGHAWACDRIGDRLPRRQGRLTLNPLVHADPIGTIALPLLFLVTSGGLGFGWGKPVEHTTLDRKRRVFIAFAGPMMNIVLAVTIAVIHVALLATGTLEPHGKLHTAIVFAVGLNFMLFFFNLLPAAPLDGGSVARGLIPRSWVDGYDQFAVYAPFVVMAFMFVPQIGRVLRIPAVFFANHLYSGLGTLMGFPLGPVLG